MDFVNFGLRDYANVDSQGRQQVFFDRGELLAAGRGAEDDRRRRVLGS